MSFRSERILRQKQKALKRRRGLILISLIVVLSLVAIILLIQKLSQRDLIKSEFYFVDSKYENIKSQVDKRSSKDFQSIVEYPNTNNNKVNQLILEALRPWQDEFFATVKKKSWNGLLANQHISYQVYRNDDRVLSLALFINQDLRGAHPISRTLFWTFDQKTGRALKLSELLDAKADQSAFWTKLVQLIQTKIRQVNHTEVDAESVEQILRGELSFVSKNETTLELPFGRGVVGPESAGEINLTLNVNDFSSELRSGLARTIFSIKHPSPTRKIQAKARLDQVLALTFDDGPGHYTVQLLDILERYRARASFFVLGSQVAARADLLKMMRAKGHEIGNHSFNHPDLTKIPLEQAEAEISKTNALIENVLKDYKVTVFRPPYGAYNQRIFQLAQKHGLAKVLWSIDTRDWADRDAAIVCNRAVASARPGAVILLHDIHASSVAAMPCILDKLGAKGYKFVTVSELFSNKLEAGETYFGN